MTHIVARYYRGPNERNRLVSDAVRNLVDGKGHAAGEVTLTASTASTVVTDLRAGVDSVITFMPKTANAAAEVGNGTMYVSSRGKQTFTITHANNAQTDRDFEYSISGTGRGT